MPRCCHGQRANNGLETIKVLTKQLGTSFVLLQVLVHGLQNRRREKSKMDTNILSLRRTRPNVDVKTETSALAPKIINLTWVQPTHNDTFCMRHLGSASFHAKG